MLNPNQKLNLKILIVVVLIIIIGFLLKENFFRDTNNAQINNDKSEIKSDVVIAENQKLSLMCNDLEDIFSYYKNLDTNFRSDCLSGKFSTNLFPKITDTDSNTLGFIECYTQTIKQDLSSEEDYQQHYGDCNDSYQMSHYNYVGGGAARERDEAAAICDNKMQVIKFANEESANNFSEGCLNYLYFFQNYDEWWTKWSVCSEKYKKSNYNDETIQDRQGDLDYCMNN